ncbi:MAG: type II toxin-antitoxin system HicB family antitoxin [Clostridia bacterium]|nr:type II toxin-antitoxin system HicB family antitoxin [Clostridia bacterium]
MEYRGYIGSIEFSEEDCLLFGKVQGIRALISYEGTTAQELVEDFHGAVEDYLAMCEERGEAPEKAYKGSFNVRISPQLHQQAAVYAISQQISLNSLVETALRSYVTTR